MAISNELTLMKPDSSNIIYQNAPAASAIWRIAFVFLSAILVTAISAGSLEHVLDLKLCITNSQKGMLALQWPASVGSTYQLQWNINLSSPVWASLTSSMAVTDGVMVLDREATSWPQCFYITAYK